MISSLFLLLRPLLHAFDAEDAHQMTINALALLPNRQPPADDPRLHQRIAGLDFPNPVGIAAGFDKNAQAMDAMLGLGFGFAEIGTVTPLPQQGNPRPRLFRPQAWSGRHQYRRQQRRARPNAGLRHRHQAICSACRLFYGQYFLAQHARPARSAT